MIRAIPGVASAVETMRAVLLSAQVGLLSALVTLAGGVPAAADHGGPLRSAPMGPVTAALLFAGLALLVGAIVIVVVRVLTKER